VHRSFEPNRLSPTFLAQAYEKIIPHHIRVIHFEMEHDLEQDEGDQASQSRRVS
jgi:hypothetical protein